MAAIFKNFMISSETSYPERQDGTGLQEFRKADRKHITVRTMTDLRQCCRSLRYFEVRSKIVNWLSKSVGVGAALGSLSDGLRHADGGITGQLSFGLSLSDQINALSRREFGLTEWAKDNRAISAQHQLFISYRATDLLNDMQSTAPVSIFFDGLDQLLERNVATYMGARCSEVLACKTNATRWSEEEIRHSWVDLTKLRWERDWFRNASSNVRSWVTYLDEYVGNIWYGREDAWTSEFLKLDPRVLEKDDWEQILHYPGFAGSEVVPLIRGYLPGLGEHFKEVSDLLQDLRKLLVRVEGIKNHFDWLYQLSVSLLDSFYRCCSLFLSQRSWFLHHSAHPPHARDSHSPGFGGAGALLQLS